MADAEPEAVDESTEEAPAPVPVVEDPWATLIAATTFCNMCYRIYVVFNSHKSIAIKTTRKFIIMMYWQSIAINITRIIYVFLINSNIYINQI